MDWRRWAWCLAFVAILASSRMIGWAADEQKEPPAPPSKEEQYFELMRVVADTFEQIERNYVKEVDRRALVEAAIKGMMEELDPYSNYISPDELSRFNAQVEQEFGGIGIQVTIDPQSRRLTVMTPLPGTPAYKAGIRAGDTIMEIEGKSTEGITQVEQAVKLLKGKPGEPVTIGVMHMGMAKVEQVTMVRAIIHVSTVLGDTHKADDSWNFMLDEEKKLGYVRLTSFGRDSARELKEALDELKTAGLRGLILDLRFNPGGLLTAATEVSDLFLKEGQMIVSTKGRNTAEKVANAKRGTKFAEFPMVVLVNRFSASASEIVSAALQDHKRAVVVGERTWGKGSVQNVIELENGKSALKLTTASYHRPSGKNIHRFPGAKDTDEWGVMPDDTYGVQFTNDDFQKYLEMRRQRDILSKEPVAKNDFVDKQLEKALEYLTSQLSGEKPAGEKPAAAEKSTEAKTEEKKAAEKPATEAKPEEKGKAESKPEEKKAKESTARPSDLPRSIGQPVFRAA